MKTKKSIAILLSLIILLACGVGENTNKIIDNGTEPFTYNFKTQTYQQVKMDTVTNFEPYIPQYPAAINMYRLYVYDLKEKPIDAYLKVLSACIGSGQGTS